MLTEVGSGYYAITPAIAAAAGARAVYALTRNSRHGRADEVTKLAVEVAAFVGPTRLPEVVTELTGAIVGGSDIVTNLGFVRPIDRAMVELMKNGAVVPLMCETWEWRPEDVDLHACQQRGVPVIGTNEEHPDVDVLAFCGNVAIQLLLAAGIEVYKSSIVVVGRDKFAPLLAKWLGRLESKAVIHHELTSARALESVGSADALLVADYCAEPVIGNAGLISAERLHAIAPGIVVVQFAGGIDAAGLKSLAVAHFPRHLVGARRMSRTLASIGPRPVIDLHAAGLKVAQLALASRRAGTPLSNEQLYFRGSPLGTLLL